MKSVIYTCDIKECQENGEFLILTELQNGSSVYSVNERHSCGSANHLGFVILGEGSLGALITEATKNSGETSRGAPVEKWSVRGTRVVRLNT